MDHGLIRTATLKTIVSLITERFGGDENEAYQRFNDSHTGKCFADDSTGLYGQSAIHVFSLFCDEISKNS